MHHKSIAEVIQLGYANNQLAHQKPCVLTNLNIWTFIFLIWICFKIVGAINKRGQKEIKNRGFLICPTYFYTFFDITKCHEKKSFAEEHQVHCISTSWAFFWNFCLGAEIFELEVQRAMVRRPFMSNLLSYMFLWEPSVMKSRFLLNIIRETSACNPGMFFSTCKALILFDLGVHYMVQIPIKSDQISPCISNYEIK